MKIIDAHCHTKALKKGIPSDVLPVLTGFSHSENKRVFAFASEHSLPYVLGIAPQTVLMEGEERLEEWIDFIRSKKPKAIGEVGLDYHWGKTEEDFQKERRVFERMISLAEDLSLPLVIHSRKAEEAVIEILKERDFRNGVMFHFFAGDLATAEKAISIGGWISIPPIHSKMRRRIIEKIPLENLLVETDAPYVGRSCEDVKKSIQYIAEVKSMDFDTVAEKTAENAKRFFSL